MIEAATEALLPDIEEWASVEDVSDARELLRDALRWDDDGYELARAFDRAGWSVDSGLVHILDNADSAICRAHAAAVKAWIVATGARPRFSNDTPVVLPAGQDAGARGLISDINDTAGTYTVFVESLGHVRKGIGIHGRIFAWEVLEAANAGDRDLAVDRSRSTPKEVEVSVS